MLFFFMKPKGYKPNYRRHINYRPSFHEWMLLANFFTVGLFFLSFLFMILFIENAYKMVLITLVGQVVTGLVCAVSDPKYYYW